MVPLQSLVYGLIIQGIAVRLPPKSSHLRIFKGEMNLPNSDIIVAPTHRAGFFRYKQLALIKSPISNMIVAMLMAIISACAVGSF